MSASPARLEELGRRVLAVLARYLQRSARGEAPVVTLPSPRELRRELRPEEWRRGGADDDAIIEFLERYLERTTRLHHPGYIAHQVAVPHEASALADLINGVLNNGMSIYEMGPAHALLEQAMLDWLLEQIGWARRGGGAGGVLTHGGALANLTALAAARAAVAPDAWEEGCPGDLVVLASATSHYSVARSVALLGLGARALVPVAADDLDRMRADALGSVLDGVRAAGQRVMAVVVNACATGTGLYDPVAETAEFCREHGLWLHVDGCHGASALLSQRLRGLLAGIEHADSVVWDAHKMLRTSNLCTAVLCRDAKRLEGAFRQRATYLIRGESTPGINQVKRSIECTKTGLGLKLFLTLACVGEDGLARHVEHLVARTLSFHALISARHGFHCPYVPESNILCFRYGDDDEQQDRIRSALIADGRYYITAADVGGRRHLRLSVMNPLTDEPVIEGLLDTIESLA